MLYIDAEPADRVGPSLLRSEILASIWAGPAGSQSFTFKDFHCVTVTESCSGRAPVLHHAATIASH